MSAHIPVIRLRTPEGGFLAARDGIILCFFMHRSHLEVAPAVWRVLQAYLRAIPPQSLAWYGSTDGDILPLDDNGWEQIRKRVLETPLAHMCNVELAESASEVGGYQFEYRGRRLDSPFFAQDEGATSALSFSFPTEYLAEHGPAHLRSLSLELARELPFSFGYASLAFVSVSGSGYPEHQELLGLLSRYHGLDLYDLERTSERIGTGARGAYWLTFLGQPLLSQLGGVERLRQELSLPEVSLQPLEGERVLLTLGEWPDPIDTTVERNVPQYRTLARLLEPYFPEEATRWGAIEEQKAHQWLRRLCQ